MIKSIGQLSFSMVPATSVYAGGLAQACVTIDFQEKRPMRIINVHTFMSAKQGAAHNWKQGGADNIWYTLSPPDAGLVNSYEGEILFTFNSIKQAKVTLTPVLGASALTNDVYFKGNTNNLVSIEMMTFNSITVTAYWKWSYMPVSTHSNSTNPTLFASVCILVEY